MKLVTGHSGEKMMRAWTGCAIAVGAAIPADARNAGNAHALASSAAPVGVTIERE